VTLVSRVGFGLTRAVSDLPSVFGAARSAARRLGLCAHSARVAMLAGVALMALAPAAFAAPSEKPLPALTPAPAKPPAAAAANDGLSGGGFYIEADTLTQDDANHTVIAEGHVVARYGGRTLKAGKVIYDRDSGVVNASEGVTMINPDGTAEFSQSAVLDKAMSQGVAIAFSTRLQGNISVAAATAVRRSPDWNELNEVIYTPCPVCAKNPTPTWSFRARKAVEDKKRQIVFFRDAILVVKGIPVFYIPVFWQVDPAVDRKSGFLLPTVGVSTMRGFSWEQPYLQIISRSEDLVISPQINSKVNPLLNVEWRKRFYSGAIDIRAGYTYDRDFDSHGNRFGDLTSRSYILAKGLFAIDEHWRWGFTAERVSDPLIFDKYQIAEPFVERGLYAADDRRLTSQLFTTRQDANSYISVAAISVQGLRTTDVNATFPTIAPLIEAHFEPPTPILGGRLRLDGSAVVLSRDESPTDPTLPGINSRRGTFQADWRRTFIFSNGLRIDPFLQGRVDYYNLTRLPAPYASNASVARGFGTAGFDVTWPFFKRVGPVTYVLTPVAQLAISPNTQQDPRIPIEDSVDFELDSTNLFQVNKSPGFDLYEGGQRVNLGARATTIFDDGRRFTVLAGRSFRLKNDPALPARSGIATAASDWVFAAEGNVVKGLDLFGRVRLDSGNFSVNRLEVGADVSWSRFNGTLRYLQEAQDASGAVIKDLDFHGAFFVTKHWGVTVAGARDFATGDWRQREFGIVYKDDCVQVEVVYDRNDTVNSTLGPTSSIAVRLTLATFGNSGYRPGTLMPSR